MRGRMWGVVMGVLLGWSPVVGADEAALRALLARARTVDGDRGVSKSDQALAKQIAAYGKRAKPGVLALLQSDDARVRSFAGYVLGDMAPLGEEDLGTLEAAHRAGNAWVAGPIARIGGPRAVAFLVAALVETPERGTQVTYGLQLLGEPAATAIAAQYEKDDGPSERFTAAACEVLQQLTSGGEIIARRLEVVLRDEKRSIAGRRAAVAALACVGVPARAAIPALEAFARAFPDAKRSAQGAILTIGGPAAVPTWLEVLRREPSSQLLRDLAAHGQPEAHAGPALVELLSAPDWTLRVDAVRALGYLGYREAIPALVPLLDDVDDWRLVWATAETLGRLGAKQHVAALQRIAKSFWFAPVRAAAQRAVQALTRGSAYPSLVERQRFDSEFWAYERVHRSTERTPPALVRHRLPDALSPAERARHTYPARIGGRDGEPASGRTVTRTPSAGLEIPGGFLLGSHMGEWGGELVFVGTDHVPILVLRENIHGIYRLGDRIVALTGLAHLLGNRGAAYEIERSPEGSFRATEWKALPGAPHEQWMLDDGSLYVGCHSGNVIIGKDGSMREP